MSIVKNYVTIRLELIQIGVLEVTSYNNFEGLSGRVCVPNETEDLSLHISIMKTGINESRTLTN